MANHVVGLVGAKQETRTIAAMANAVMHASAMAKNSDFSTPKKVI
jgi:hypothetical protein